MTTAVLAAPISLEPVLEAPRRTPVAGFLGGLLLHQIANNALRLAQPLLISQLSGSLGHAAFFAAFETTVHMAGTLAGGWPADRLGARRLLVLGAALRALSLTAIAFSMASGTLTLAFAVSAYVLDSFFRGLLDTAEHALPLGFAAGDREELDRLNSRYELVFDLGGVAGPVMVGVLMAGNQGLAVHFAIPLAFAAAALAYAFIPRRSVTERPRPAAAAASGGTVEGIRLVLKDPRLLFGVVSLAMLNIFPLRKLLSALYAKSILGSGAAAGWIGASYGLGGALGSLLYARWGGTRGGRWVACGALGMAALAASFFPGGLWPMLAGSFLFAVTNAGARLSLTRDFQQATPLDAAGGVTAVSRFAANIVSVALKALVGAAFALGAAPRTAFGLVAGGLGLLSLMQLGLAARLSKETR